MSLELSLDNWNATVLQSNSVPVSMAEAALFDLVDSIRYGSIHNVEIVDNTMVTTRRMNTRRQALLTFMREQNHKIDELVIHDGEVAYINIEGQVPYRHIRRFKF